MANVNENDNWGAGVYQYADGDVLDGGPDSSETLPIRQLASRSLYQRLRNVTPWDAGLAAQHTYPAGACVLHAGVTWRAKVNTSAEPGTDDTKWERWAFTAAEMTDVINALAAVRYTPQALSTAQQKQARTNIRAIGSVVAIPAANEGLIWVEGTGFMVWNDPTGYEPINVVQSATTATTQALVVDSAWTNAGASVVARRTGLANLLAWTSCTNGVNGGAGGRISPMTAIQVNGAQVGFGNHLKDSYPGGGMQLDGLAVALSVQLNKGDTVACFVRNAGGAAVTATKVGAGIQVAYVA
ncbi:hypothetical protein [Hydrogenophaga electricum]|uniref:Minor tail protein n=1 Tax=Hydrogenophaga electricum TaxID=1230953 RepID=A0ABQ6BZR6_9BURK|nr:hypothetical protein [Hydrogenophaga electricum]GLS13601.1 hypothetical protein GCM10007935_10310 [Hydrogenophaga electricum]